MRINIKQLHSDIAGPILFQQDNTVKSNILFRFASNRLEIGAADFSNTVLLNEGGLQFNTPLYGTIFYPRQGDSDFGNVLGNGAFEIASYSAAGMLIGTISNKPVVLGTNNLPRIYIDADGDISLTSLAGGTTQMVVADVNGYLTKQNIPDTIIGLSEIGYGHPSTGVLTSNSGFKFDPTLRSMRLDTVADYAKWLIQGWTGISTGYPAIYALPAATAPTSANYLITSDLVSTYFNSISGDLKFRVAGGTDKVIVTTGGTGTTYFDGSKMSIGAALTGGYNGSYGIYNSRAGTGLDRHFVGESALNSAGALAIFELRNYNDVTSRFLNYANVAGASLTGTSIALDGALRIDNTIGTYSNNLSANGKVITTGSEIFGIIGTTATNYGTRLDANGFRIGILSSLHTANTAGTIFEAGYVTMNTSGSILNITVSNQTEIGFSGGGVANIYHNTSGQEMSLGVNNGGLLFTADAFGHYSTAIYPTYIINSSTSTTSHFGTRLDANGFRIGAISSLGTINTYEFDVDGEIRATSQAGIGNRLVEANSLGVQSATTEIVFTYITDTVVIDLLENSTNWDSNGNYIGTPITGTYEGQRHYDSTFLYECVSDNVWIRIITTFNAVPNLEIAFGTGTSLQSNSRFTITDLGITAKSKTQAQGYNYGYSPAFLAETNGNNSFPAFVFDKNAGSTKYGSIIWQDENYPALTSSGAGLHAVVNAYKYNATRGVFEIRVQNNLGTTAPTTIFQSIGTAVNFGSATNVDYNPDNIVFGSNFSFGKMRYGSSTGSAVLGIQSTFGGGYSGSIFGQSDTNLGAFYFNNSGIVGNFSGTNLPIASTTNLQSGSGYQLNLHIASGYLTAQTGTVTTNYGFRLDSAGFRIGLNNTIHTANTQPFQVGNIRYFSGDIFYGGAGNESFLQIAAGVAQVGHYATRTTYINGSIATYIDGGNRMLITPTTTTIYTDTVVTTLAGTDDRMVEADATGLLTATTIIRDQWITDITTINLLEDDANWSLTGEYIGTVITGTYEGQQNVDDNFLFLCISDNNWIRMARV